jgi:hypothetical protein
LEIPVAEASTLALRLSFSPAGWLGGLDPLALCNAIFDLARHVSHLVTKPFD